MATTAKRKTTPKKAVAKRSKPKPAPVDEVVEEPVEEVIPTESQWATPDDLPKNPWEDRDLPTMGKKVRIRYITNAEATGLGVLPDLARFGELLIEGMAIDPKKDKRSEPEKAKQAILLVKEKSLYMELVAHLCVIDPNGGMSSADCCSVATEIGPHPKSLWSREQVTLLESEDLGFITNVAERTVVLESVRPLSPDHTPSDTPSPASSGE